MIGSQSLYGDDGALAAYYAYGAPYRDISLADSFPQVAVNLYVATGSALDGFCYAPCSAKQRVGIAGFVWVVLVQIA